MKVYLATHRDDRVSVRTLVYADFEFHTALVSALYLEILRSVFSRPEHIISAIPCGEVHLRPLCSPFFW